MRNPCTNCPHNVKSHIIPPNGGPKIVLNSCHLLGYSMGYYEVIANCEDYAEYLAWQRVNRKSKQTKSKTI